MQIMTDVFWDVATSAPALAVDGILLLVAVVVGWFPLVKWVPVLGEYVPTARLVTFLVAVVMSFMLGARVMDERADAASLRVELASKKADLEIAENANVDAIERANNIEGEANAQHAKDQKFIADLENKPGCGFDPGKPDARGLRVKPGTLLPFRFFGSAPARSPATAGDADKGSAGSGS